MAEESDRDDVHLLDTGDENLDLQEPEAKKQKMNSDDEKEEDELESQAVLTPSRKLRAKVAKDEREAEKAKRMELKRQKDEEREKAKAEKERLAEEKKLEKERKDREREEKKKEEERKKEEKRKADEEKKEQRRKEEEERQRKKAQKKKEEEERQEAKRREEEDKRREEEAEEEKKKRASARFIGFFKKITKEETKPAAISAPLYRRSPLPRDADILTQRGEITGKTYLCSDAVKKRRLICARKDELKAKLFQFHDNYRPPYYGSWRKKDKNVKPRNPWKPSSTAIDYEVDSDAEWEDEPSDAEECKSDEEDPDVDEQDSDADEFMVEPGYLSDGEGQEESDESNERDAEGRAERLAARASEWKRNVLNKSKALIPLCVGPTLEPKPPLLAYQAFVLP